MTELALLTGFSVTGTRPHADGHALLLETPAGARDFGIETLKHTRLSSWLRYAIDKAVTRPGGAVLSSLSGNTGIVSASRYGCVRATDETRKGQRSGGILGVDPIRFAKATHVYPLAANAIDRGWRGPMTAFVGDDETGWHALLFAARQLANAAADLMYVVTYDEIDAAVLAHLRHGGTLGSAAEKRLVAEALSVVALARADRFPDGPTLRIDTTSGRGTVIDDMPDQPAAPTRAIDAETTLGSTVIHWLARHIGVCPSQKEEAAIHIQPLGYAIGNESSPRQYWRARVASRHTGEKK